MDFTAQRFTHLADLAWIWAAQFLPRLGAAVLILVVGFVAAGAMVLNLRVWTEPQGVGAVERAIVEAIKRALEALGEKFAPTQIVRQTPPDSDPSRYLEAREPVHAA